MKFNDIKRFTGIPHYMIHIPIDSVEEWCNKKTCGPLPDLNPDFLCMDSESKRKVCRIYTTWWDTC